MGLFISFEGVDGCGKSRQTEFLAEYLRGQGHEVLTTREPGGCAVSEQIRAILLDPGNTSMTPLTEALLYAAARAQHVEEVIRPALNAGKTVICDRYVDSSIAYQGSGRHLGNAAVESVNAFAINGLLPDITFFLDVPPEEAMRRMHDRSEKDRLEAAGMAFQNQLYKEYLQLLKKHPARIRRIDASGSKYETHDKIRDSLTQFLEERKQA